MKELRFTVGAAQGGARLDQLIAQEAPELSRARAQQLIDEGQVEVALLAHAGEQAKTLEPRAVKPGLRVRAGASVIVRIPAPRAVELEPVDLQLTSLYEDAHLIVIDKPPGIAVHPGAGTRGPTLVHGLLHRIRDLRGIGGELRPGIVHRLDKDTSGCLVVAKSEAALQGLQAQFKARSVEKRYLAIAHGALGESGEMDTLYARHPIDRKRFSSTVREGKRAVTRWRRLATSVGPAGESPRVVARGNATTKRPAASGAVASVAEVQLLTGRTHQIRAHFADAGHPLLGDLLYGGKKREAKLDEDSLVRRAAERLGRQALHAWVLEFAHPITRARVSCTAPLPDDLRAALALLAIDPESLRPALDAAGSTAAALGLDDDCLAECDEPDLDEGEADGGEERSR